MSWYRMPCIGLLLAPLACGAVDSLGVRASESGRFTVDVIVRGLSIPSAICAMPDGSLLVAERRPAALRRVDVASGAMHSITGLPAIHAVEDAGLHDIVLHPDFAQNRRVYFSYSAGEPGDTALVLARAMLEGDVLRDAQPLFTAAPRAKDNFHYGGRIVFDGPVLYLTSGDRHLDAAAQDTASHLGKVLRLDHDGRAALGNPYAADAGAKPEIWAMGLRNVQGLAYDRARKALWAVDHGPHGGDELDRIERRANYGWPIHTWGFAYEGGLVGLGPKANPAFTSPLHVWSPGRAPSDLVVYDGSAFPSWNGSLLLGAMAGRALIRLVVDERGLVLEERLLLDLKQRIRAVEQGRDGEVFVATDEGMLLRLRPAD